MAHTPLRNGAHVGSTGATMEQNPEPNCRNLVRAMEPLAVRTALSPLLSDRYHFALNNISEWDS